MADPTVAAEYRRLRREYPRNPASQTILWARGNVKPTDLEWNTFDGSHFATAKTQRDGFNIKVTVDYDEYATPTISTTDTDTGIKNPNFKWREDPYASRDSYHSDRFISLESDSTVHELAPYYHRTGDAKNVAWERARESLQEEAKGYLGDDYVQLVFTAKAYVDGVELGEGSVGADLIIDWRGSSLEKELDNILSETDIIAEAIEEARKAIPGAIEKMSETLAALSRA